MEIFETLKKLVSSDNKEGENSSGNLVRNLIIMGAIGCIFLFAGNIFSNPGQPSDNQKIIQNKNEDIKKDDYVTNLENDLEDAISLVKGIGRVRVQIIISRSTDYQYEYNQNVKNKITNETDRNGGEREIKEDSSEKDMIIIKDAEGNEKPVVKVEKMPVISGVMIIAEGVEKSNIKYEIYNAVSSFLNLPVHKISVLPYQEGRN